jgi:GTP-binding protein
MQFIDEAEVSLKAGKGGNGRASFLRLRHRSRAGPDGGDGGRGGDIIFKVDSSLNSLLDFKYRKVLEAEDGENGGPFCRTGKNGRNLVVKVPLGTQLRSTGGSLFFDMAREGLEFLVAKGGNGGFGNVRFKSSENQAPRSASPGEAGNELDLILQLKILSDVGIIGLANVGKSTFLSITTNARPKIAEYEFTTLKPQLGIVSVEGCAFTMIDLPGLAENAGEGRGLGNGFLKHAERCSVLLHLIDACSEDPLRDYQIVRREIESEKYDISAKTEIVAITKIDLLDPKTAAEKISKLKTVVGKEILAMSGQSMVGVDHILHRLRDTLEKIKENPPLFCPLLASAK